MKIDKLFNGLKRIANGDYVWEGDLISEETIEIDLDDRFVVKGRIESKKSIIIRCGIKAGRGIKAGCGIEAGWGIKAGYGIEAGDGIKAGRGIEAGWGIKAGYGIKAGWDIKAGWGIKAGCGIEAGDGIKAGWGIEAGYGIEAGWGIEARTFISVKKRIFAGLSIYCTSNDCNKKIRCAELRAGEVCYGDLTLTGSEEKTDED